MTTDETSPLAGTMPATASAATNPSERTADFNRYFATRTHLGNLAFSPDGGHIAYIVNTSGQFNAWQQAVQGGWAAQVTTFEDASVRIVAWAPSGTLVGVADRAGTEQYQVFAIPALGGAVRYFTDRPDVQYEFSADGLAPDGRTLALSANDRVPTDGDILLLDLGSGDMRRVLANGRYNIAVNWSPDGRMVAVADVRSNTNVHLWLLDVATGESREILPHEDECFLVAGPWLPDASGLYLITDRGREYKGIARYSLATETMDWVIAPEWDVEQCVLSQDGRRMLWTVNESGRSQLYVRDEGRDATLRVAGLPLGVIEQLSLTPDGRTAALRINAATAPADIYVLSLGPLAASEPPRLRRLTYGMLGGLEREELTEPELVSYPTFDGRQIPAWLYRPRVATPDRQVPLVLAIHGGPEAQERVEYHAFYQYLVARGFAILAPNIRGSTGYGVSYQRLIYRDWGGAELKDIQAAAEYLRALPWVLPDHIGIYGGSFGGFATLSAVTRLPDYWAAAVDIVGPSNLLTFVRSVPPTWQRMMAAWVGDPEADADLLRARSPLTYVDQVRAPLLILQGANDPRVARAESDQMVERLRSLGREVEYVVFEDEGHGFTKRRNQLRAYRLAAEFFEQHLMTPQTMRRDAAS